MRIRLALPLLIVMGLLISASAFAQDAVITGRVTTRRTAPASATPPSRSPSSMLSATTDTTREYTLTVPADPIRRARPSRCAWSAATMQSKTAKVTLAAGTLTQNFALGSRSSKRSPSARAPRAPRPRRPCRWTSSPSERSRASGSHARPPRSSRRSRPRSISRGRRSPTAPIPSGRPRCAASARTRFSSSSTASAGTRARSSTSTGRSAAAPPVST